MRRKAVFLGIVLLVLFLLNGCAPGAEEVIVPVATRAAATAVPLPSPTAGAETSAAAAADQAAPTATAVVDSGPWKEVGAGSARGGGVSQSSSYSVSPSIAAAPDGTVWLSWHDDKIGNSEIYLSRWDGAAWQGVAGSDSGGGVSRNRGQSERVDVAITAEGVPFLVWEDDSAGNSEIYAAYYDGSAWQPAGEGAASGGGISKSLTPSVTPQIDISDSGTLYVCWTEELAGNAEVYVLRFAGGEWWEISAGSAGGGGISGNEGDSRGCTVSAPADDNLQVAWRDDSGGAWQIVAQHWNGISWEFMGQSQKGGISNSQKFSGKPRLMTAPDGRTYLAWRENTGPNFEIYITAWDGAQWQPLGSGSASGGGASDTPGDAEHQDLGFSTVGFPLLAWTEVIDDAESQIYVKEWDGEAWVEMGGSASAGGISKTQTASNRPAITTAPDGTVYVAWYEEGTHNSNIYVRAWRDAGVVDYE